MDFCDFRNRWYLFLDKIFILNNYNTNMNIYIYQKDILSFIYKRIYYIIKRKISRKKVLFTGYKFYIILYNDLQKTVYLILHLRKLTIAILVCG